VAVFGAIVLSGGAAVIPGAVASAGAAGAGEAAAAFSRVFLAATASLTVTLIALLLLAEKPLQTNVRQASQESGPE
jgi:hypothetical protein